MNLKCFKAYDIRGCITDERSGAEAWRIERPHAEEV
jgi:hypothetical protein